MMKLVKEKKEVQLKGHTESLVCAEAVPTAKWFFQHSYHLRSLLDEAVLTALFLLKRYQPLNDSFNIVTI